MKIKIACVGKVKDAFYRDAVSEYVKRLSRFCTLEIAEVSDEKALETLSPAEEAQVMEREGEKLLARQNLQRCGFFNPDYVKRLLNYEMEGVPGLRHGLKLWMLITFLLWYEQMVEAPLPVLPIPNLRVAR